MLLFIPRGIELNHNRRIPVLSYGIVIVCLIVFYFQYQNHVTLDEDIATFCKSIHSNESEAMNQMVSDNHLCQLMIKRLEQRPKLNTQEIIHQYFWFEDYSPQKIDEMAGFIQEHHASYIKTYTRNLNKALVYFPESPNPIRMLSSAVSHGDILHLLGNLIFFLAFAPALEILMASMWKFIVVNLSLLFTTSMAYSASVLLGQDALPALGLSGIVMGMIGLFAAMMPREKIKVFVWIIIYMKNIYIPAWILAVWYIGWDGLELILGLGDPAINLLSHVVGGITGYALGYFWLKNSSNPINNNTLH